MCMLRDPDVTQGAERSWCLPMHCTPSITCSRRCLLAAIIIVFIPIVPLVRRLLVPRTDVQAYLTSSNPSEVTSYGGECVVKATGSAHGGRVIAVKRMREGRLGNDMFVYASMIGIAARNKMVPVYNCDALSRTFHVTGTGNYVIRQPASDLIEDFPHRCCFVFHH